MPDASSISISRLLRHPAASAESLESIALLLGAAFFAVGFTVSLIAFWGRSLTIAGPGSLGEYVGIGSAITAVLSFLLGRVLVERRPVPAVVRGTTGWPDPEGARLTWFDVVALALAHAVIVLLGWVGVADLLERSFIDAVVFAFPAAVFAGVAFALTAYVVFLSSANLTPLHLSLLLAAFLVVGALASMLSASDPHWWMSNLSALGMTDDLSALTFNFTLIIAGVLLTIIARYAAASIPARTDAEVRGRRIFLVGLMLVGILLTLVGVFPIDRFLIVHNIVSMGMTVVFGAIVIGLHWLIPAMPRVFILLGYVYLGVMAFLTTLFFVGSYTLTAVELVSAVLIFSWIIVFLRIVSAMRRPGSADTTGGPEAAPSDTVPLRRQAVGGQARRSA